MLHATRSIRSILVVVAGHEGRLSSSYCGSAAVGVHIRARALATRLSGSCLIGILIPVDQYVCLIANLCKVELLWDDLLLFLFSLEINLLK